MEPVVLPSLVPKFHFSATKKITLQSLPILNNIQESLEFNAVFLYSYIRKELLKKALGGI